MSNFKKLIIPALVLVVLVAAYVIVQNLPEPEEEEINSDTEETIAIFDFKKDDVSELKIETDEETLWFRYVTIQVEEEETNEDGTVETKMVDRNVWQAVEPEDMEPNTSAIDNIVWNANTLKAQNVIEEAPSDLTIYGLDNPKTLTFIMKDGTSNILYLGNEAPTGGVYYAKKEGEQTVYSIGSYEGEKFLRTKFDLMVKDLYEGEYAPEDFTEVSFTRKGDKIFDANAGEDGKWRLSYPIEAEAHDSNIFAICQSLAGISVDRYVAEDVQNLGKYGLEEPSYVFEFSVKGQEYKLALGDREPAGGAFYAVMNDKNLVFMVLESNFTFLDKPIEEIVDSFVHLQNINEVREMRVSIDGRTDISRISVDKDDEEKSTYEFNGTLLTGDKDEDYISAFKKYYQGAIGLLVDKVALDVEPVLENPEVTIEYILNSGEEIVVELVSAPDNVYYYAFKNGKYTGMMVRKKQLEDEYHNGLRVSYQKLVDELEQRIGE